MSAHRSRSAVLAVVAVATFGLASCDGDGALSDLTLPGGGTGGGETTEAPAPDPTDAPAPDPTDAPAPQPTDAPAPQPTDAPAPEPTTSPDDGTGDDDNTGLWLVLLGLLAVVAIIAVLVGTRKKSPAATPYATPVDRRTELIATATWIHDQLTLELLAMPPAEAQQRWIHERSRLDQLAIDGRAMAASGYREMWDQLAVILSQLSSSIDTALRVGTMQGADPNLVAEAVNNAHARRAELGAWVATARSFG